MRVVGAVPVAVLLLASAGCSGGSGHQPAAQRQPSASVSPSSAASSAEQSDRPLLIPHPSRAAQRRLDRAVQGTVAAPVIPFSFRMTVDDENVTHGSGGYVIDESAYEVTYTTDPSVVGGDGGPLQVKVRSHGRGLWMQMPAWQPPARGCWLTLRRGQVPLGMLSMRAGSLGYVAVLGSLRAGNSTGPTMVGSLTLIQAATLFNGQMFQKIGASELDSWGGVRVPVQIELTNERVRGVTVAGSTLRTAFAKLGLQIPDTDENPLGRVLDSFDVTVRYPGHVSRAPIVDPPRGTTYSARDKGCH